MAVLVLTSLGLYFLVKAHLLEDAIRKTVRNFIKEMVPNCYINDVNQKFK